LNSKINVCICSLDIKTESKNYRFEDIIAKTICHAQT